MEGGRRNAGRSVTSKPRAGVETRKKCSVACVTSGRAMDRSLGLVVARGSRGADRVPFGVQPEGFRSRGAAIVC